MPIECVPSNLESDIRCAVCGQGFLLSTRRVTSLQRAAMRIVVQNALRNHHDEVHSSHPHESFAVEIALELSAPALPHVCTA